MSATVNQVNQVPHWPPRVQPHAPPRSTTRFATFNRTPRHVLHHATSNRSTSRLRTTRHCRSPHLRSPILLTSAHRICSFPLANSQPAKTNAHTSTNDLTLKPTNAHASTNEHSRLLNEHSSPQHSTRSRHKHNLLSFLLLGSV